MVDPSTIAVLIWLKLYSTRSTRRVVFLMPFLRLDEPYQPPFKPFLRLGEP